VDYQTGATTCPKCGSADQVRTVRELFDMMNGARQQAFQRFSQFQQPGQTQAQGQNWNSGDDDDYDHYNVEGSGPNRRYQRPSFDRDVDYDDIGGAILGTALGFAGRAIGKRMKRAFQEKVVPAMEARAAQAQQQWEQSQAEQDAIVERYPELRGCLADQVMFIDGGYRTVPVSELKMPVTLAQADDVVARLR
jgi:uncharacterized coiled-coil protein SlyX